MDVRGLKRGVCLVDGPLFCLCEAVDEPSFDRLRMSGMNDSFFDSLILSQPFILSEPLILSPSKDKVASWFDRLTMSGGLESAVSEVSDLR